MTTQIAVNNGDTAVIGGIYEETLRNEVDKVPWLGDLPVFGYLFKTMTKASEKTELLIFLTPRVVKDLHHRGPLVRSVLPAPRWGRLLLHYNAPMSLHRGNLFLVGLMGAGKAGAPGRALLHLLLPDADIELERQARRRRSRRSSRSRASARFATARKG